MKLYEINQMIMQVIDQFVDTETGEILGDAEQMQEYLDGLEMEKQSILEYLAKQVLNYRSEQEALRMEEKRLSERRARLEAHVERLLCVLDRECAGEKRDLGIATVNYRKSTGTVVDDMEAAIRWLEDQGHDECIKYTTPALRRDVAKKLITKEGLNIPGIRLEEHKNMSLK